MYQHILIPTDGSELTTTAVEAAARLAKALDARVTILSVKDPFPFSAISEMQPMPPQEFLDAQERLAQSRVKLAQEACQAMGLSHQGFTVEADHPWKAIIDTAKTHACDLIVMASHGRRGVSALLLGSETQKVLTHSKVPVLVVR